MHTPSSIMFSNTDLHVRDINAMSIQPYIPLPIKKQLLFHLGIFRHITKQPLLIPQILVFTCTQNHQNSVQ